MKLIKCNTDKRKETDRIEQLITLSKEVSLEDFDEFVIQFLERKADKKAGIIELDNLITSVNNFSLNLSFYLKQNYLLINRKEANVNEVKLYYTKKEIAKQFRVDVRTVTNWLNDGLESTEIGGVIRVSQEALNDFIQKAKSKKFNWKSIAA